MSACEPSDIGVEPCTYRHVAIEVAIPPMSIKPELNADYPDGQNNIARSPSKHHSQEADELDILCSKLSDVRVRPSSSSQPNKTAEKEHSADYEEDLRLCDVSVEQFQLMVRQITSLAVEDQRQALVKFRKLLAHEDIHPYLNRIVDSGIVPTFVELLQAGEPDLQFESAWVLTNIAAGSSQQTAAVVQYGSIPHLVHHLVRSPHKEIKEQCVWCLGNIAGDSVDLRGKVLNDGALQPLLDLISSEMNEFLASSSFIVESPTHFPSSSIKKSHNYNLSTLRIAIWALSNFCRGNGKSELDWNLIDIAMPVLSQVITCCSPSSPHTDDEILMDTCWALSRTLRGIHEGIEKVIVPVEVCAKIGELVCYQNADVQIPALRCLINIVSGCDQQTQAVIDAGLLPYLHQLLISPQNETVCKEACLIVSNITAGNIGQVQAVIDQQMVPTLVEILKYADYRTKREACWAIGNAVLNRDAQQVDYLVSQGVIRPLAQLLCAGHNQRQDDRVVIKTLETLRNILIVGDQIGKMQSSLSTTHTADLEMKLLDQFQSMQIHPETATSSAKDSACLTVDSAYQSSNDLFRGENQISNNPYKPQLLEPVADHEPLTCVDRLRHLVVVSAPQYTPSREVRDLANDILVSWFA